MAPLGLIQRGLQSALRRVEAHRTVWKGIFDRFEDVPAHGPGFDGETWIAAVRDDARRMMTSNELDSSFWGSQLATVVALVRSRPRTILDFGGGLGTACLHLERSLARGGEVAYHVVEGKRVCEEGRQLGVSRAIRYHEQLPTLDTVDVVFARSSLQYVSTWRELLASLAAYRARFVLIEDLPAGSSPTFASAQLNLPGSAIPYWFFNRDEVVREVEAHGYSLLLDAATLRTIAPRAFPPTHRIGATRDLLFELTT
jgi:putative methyltransferase (TIGR04325 family)